MKVRNLEKKQDDFKDAMDKRDARGEGIKKNLEGLVRWAISTGTGDTDYLKKNGGTS